MDKEPRTSTGIYKLDELIEGGFPQGSVIMVEGDAGTGKSTLAIQYLLAGIEQGENGVYISVDESKATFYRNMSRFGFKLAELEAAEKFMFYEFNPRQMKDTLEKGVLGIEEELKLLNCKRLVLDNITAFALFYEIESKQRNAVQTLFEKLKKWGLTTLMVAEATEEGSSQYGLRFLADGWIKLSHRKVSQERIRTIEVLKMRGTKHDSSEIVYRIEKNGINLYPSERILGPSM